KGRMGSDQAIIYTSSFFGLQVNKQTAEDPAALFRYSSQSGGRPRFSSLEVAETKEEKRRYKGHSPLQKTKALPSFQ
ncbi:hypothetical protein SK128_023617, partial [Halocaridina rubra]